MTATRPGFPPPSQSDDHLNGSASPDVTKEKRKSCACHISRHLQNLLSDESITTVQYFITRRLAWETTIYREIVFNNFISLKMMVGSASCCRRGSHRPLDFNCSCGHLTARKEPLMFYGLRHKTASSAGERPFTDRSDQAIRPGGPALTAHNLFPLRNPEDNLDSMKYVQLVPPTRGILVVHE
ncbi:hypothetical protein RRG08_047721 [Elysia crispata]|uniref:Uncharacterized protein n=1 Tax=Elysia crispata TaxID=231223 RepID=A0AAE1AA52_9GAST|nr:hypothetical protein RRG08_047721 [Elysia crispata]